MYAIREIKPEKQEEIWDNYENNHKLLSSGLIEIKEDMRKELSIGDYINN